MKSNRSSGPPDWSTLGTLATAASALVAMLTFLVADIFPAIGNSDPTTVKTAAAITILIAAAIIARWSVSQQRPYLCVLVGVWSLALAAQLLRIATPGQSIGCGVGATVTIAMIYFLTRPTVGRSRTRKLVSSAGSVAVGSVIALFSLIVFNPSIYEDDFSGRSGTWSVGKSSPGNDANFTSDGSYLLTAIPVYGGTQARAADAGDLDDVLVEVDATTPETFRTDAPGTSYWGIVCRAQDDNGDSLLKDSYYMGIWNDGLIQFRLRADEGRQQDTIAETDQYRELVSATRSNRIRAACVGNTLTLWINDKKVLEKAVEGITANLNSGTVGLFAYNDSDMAGSGTTAVSFDNLTVRRPLLTSGIS